MKKKTRKTIKKSLTNDAVYSLKIPEDVSKQFERASQKIQKQYDYDISPELLMVWILSGIHQDYLIKEFEDALAAQAAVGTRSAKR